METFKIGEIGILQNLTGWPGRYNGEEAEITGTLDKRFVQYMTGRFGVDDVYLISFDGKEVAVKPSNLRKKRPPQIEEEKERVLEAA